MKAATAPRPAIDFPVPRGVVVAKVDPLTGYLAGPYCPITIEGVFPREMAPTQPCPFHTSPATAVSAPADNEESDTGTDWQAASDDSPND